MEKSSGFLHGGGGGGGSGSGGVYKMVFLYGSEANREKKVKKQQQTPIHSLEEEFRKKKRETGKLLRGTRAHTRSLHLEMRKPKNSLAVATTRE